MLTPVRDRCLSAGTIARNISNAPRAGSPVPALLIDVVGYIRHQISAVGCSDMDGALQKAMSDFEWLILPMDRCENVPGELTSKLDDACISRFECYKFGQASEIAKASASAMAI